MKHKTVKAAATTTDKGEFSAIAAAYTVDRVQEQIVPGAFQKTIDAWKKVKRQVPLHWDHEGDPESIIGSVDPDAMRETKEGLYVEGKLDLENSEIAREAWRSMKNNALALSFGYLPTKTRKEGKVTKLLEIDLFEFSIVPAPANNDTRVLSLKSALADVEHEERVEETEFKDIAAVQAFLDETFPGHKITSTSAEDRKSNPLVQEAWDLITRDATRGSSPKSPEPEVEQPEPLDSAAIQREAWSLALKPRSN